MTVDEQLRQAREERDQFAAVVEKMRNAVTYQSRCHCYDRDIETCPTCGEPLAIVCNDSPCLNDEQFDSIKAGDYYCSACKDPDMRSGHKYWWRGQLKKEHHQCLRCEALMLVADPAECLKARDAAMRRVDQQHVERKLAAAREALAWYADEKNWTFANFDAIHIKAKLSNQSRGGYVIARQALSQIEQQKGTK